MLIVDLILLPLAIVAVLEAWSRGSLFAPIRASLEETPGKAAELLRCPFCLAYHLPWLAILYLWYLGRYTEGFWVLPIFSLAITFIVNRVMEVIMILVEGTNDGSYKR